MIIDGDNGATYAVPNLSGYTSYQWRTSSTGPYTLSTAQAYSYAESQKYVEFKPYTPPPATYTVAYHPGTNGTGSEVTDTKTQDVDLTLRGAAFTRGGFTQTGWATTDGGAKAYDLGGSYTANAAIDLYPVWTSGIVVNTEGQLTSAIANVAANGTITLGADIALANSLVIAGTKSFVIDLNGKTLSCSSLAVIQYSGSGMLTITDSSAGGGKVESAASSAIVSSGASTLTISGKATISSAADTISILAPEESTPANVLQIIGGGTVVSTGTANSAVVNNSYGNIAILSGTITGGNGIISASTGQVRIMGGTVTATSGTAISCGNALLTIIGGSVIINGTTRAMSVAPDLTNYTSYQWRTSSTGEYTLNTTQAYTYNANHTYVEFRTPPATYTVTYNPGTNGTGSEAADTKTQDVALTLRGAIFTRGGFTQTGWATSDGGAKAYDLGGSYTGNAAITLYPVWTSAFTVNTETGLAAAIANVPENGTIQLTGIINLSSTFNITGGKSFTIDLNGYTLNGSSDRGVFEVSSGTLTLADRSAGGNGKITSSVAGNTDIGTINVNGGSLVVDSGTVENLYTATSYMHTIAVTAGNVTVNGGKVERINESGFGSPDSIHNTGSGTISVNGGVVSGGRQAIYSTNGTVNVTGGEVSSDSSQTIYNTGTVNVTGGKVKNTNNSSSQAISNSGGSVNIGGGEVSGFRGIEHTGSGTVTVTDGTIEGRNEYAIYSYDDGSISVSGGQLEGTTNAIRCAEMSTCDVSVTGGALYSTTDYAIRNFGSGDLSVAGDARVESEESGAIFFDSFDRNGELTIGGSAVVTSPLSIATSGTIEMDSGTLTITGGTVENTNTGATGNAIYAPASSVTIASTSPVIIKAPGMAMTNTPAALPTSYQWRTSDADDYTLSTTQAYTYSANHTYVEFKPYTPTYTVTYRPGLNGTGSGETDTKTQDVALTLRGAIFTREGYTQTGWATTDGGAKVYDLSGSYTDNAAIDLYPVWTQNPPAPGGGDSGSGATPPAGNTVYNDSSIPDATIWLSGSGLSRSDLLVTQTITSGSNYNAMLKLANSGDILQMYDISLQSGRSSTGSAMYLTFDLTRQNARQAFTLVHIKADGTYEYFYAKAGMDGKVKFGPVYELSPFMLAKGRLLYTPTEEVVDIPKTGDASNSLPFALLALAALCGTGATLGRKKRTQA